MTKPTNDELLALYADDEGQQLVQDIHDRKAAADADLLGPTQTSEITLPAHEWEESPLNGGSPVNLVLKEFRSTVLPKECGTRKVPTWHTADEARALWEQRVSEYPVMTAVTPASKLRLSFVPGGRVTVAGDVVIDLAAAAQIKIEGMTDHD